MLKDALKSTLTYYSDSGINVLTDDMPTDLKALSAEKLSPVAQTPQAETPSKAPEKSQEEQVPLSKPVLPASIEAETLEELRTSIANYDGLSVKKTAMNMVFSDGDPEKSDVMVIGEAPGADEDRMGLPFVGRSGQLLDKMLVAINLSRKPENDQNACYISNILNWRPPGNRTPTEEEIELSLPFIEKHIELAKPKLLILTGAVSAKSLLKQTQGISKLRGKVWEYPKNADIKVIATYHPSFLLRQPIKKREAWADLLLVQKTLEDSGN